MPIIPPTSLYHLSRETVQAYLDDLAALAVRYEIVIRAGHLEPLSDGVRGYLLVTPGHLRTYDVDSDDVHAAGARRLRSRKMTSDIAGITAHQLIRRSRRRGRGA